ncbi:hypothetical protein C0992_005029 [Termitomyces sp. T32_za158]|nr:hypothetical protein C0992_005029 [Termitomyces sp. T32_za158]
MAPLHQSESASSSSSLSSSPARRIRFAPLPDPRALPAATDDNDDVRLDDVHNDDHKPCALPDVQRQRPRSILSPLSFRRNTSSSSLTPDSPKEEVFTLGGTINLFRPSSKSADDPAPSSSSGWRFNFTRFSLSSPASSPLSRTQSAQAHAQLAAPTIRLGAGGGRTPRRPSSLDAKSPLRFGHRMLNGRVYGARGGASANPFASARDEDPEFVEWGHGGMGSVRGAEHAGVAVNGRWERLQSVRPTDEDECDGSGMGWVKKRKEAREREARERAEREKAESEKHEPPPPTTTTTVVAEPEQPDPVPPEHNLTTVNIPHLARHHSHRRTTSAEAVPTLASPATPRHPSSETESETESESNPDADDDYDEDEEDEEDAAHLRRATALGAGMEKVSRHHD